MHLLKLVGFLVVMPLLFVLLSVWQADRSATALKNVQQQYAEISHQAAIQPFSSVRLNSRGPMYSAELAVGYLQNHLQALSIRHHLPWWTSAFGLWATLLGLFGLVLTTLLGYVGRQSRQLLVRLFSVAFRLLPIQLVAQMLLVVGAFASAMAFETLGLWHPGNLSNSEIKGLVAFGVLSLVGFGFVGTALKRMKSLFRSFESSSTPIYGCAVRGQEANLLWIYVATLAKRLSASPPENIVVGLMEGFFVTSNPIHLKPENRIITGRTLYLPLPYLALLNENEVKAIIGHELGHFSGEDLVYSERFVPIYVGVARSLEAVTVGDNKDFFSKIFVYPVFLLANYFMMQFEFAVKHWSRLREFAADAVGAQVTDAFSCACALVRSSVVGIRIREAIFAACDNPHTAPADLLQDILRLSREKGFDDPTPYLEDIQPHPTDTHPPTRQRIEALGQTITPQLLRSATRPIESDKSLVSYFFGEASELCKRLTSELTGAVIAHEKAEERALEEQVARVSGEYVVMESTKGNSIAVFIIAVAFFLMATLIGLHAAINSKFSLFEWGMVIGLATCGVLCFWRISLLQKQALIPVMTLTPNGMKVHGIEPAVTWDNVADFRLVLNQYGVAALTFELSPEYPLPNYIGGIKRRTVLNLKKRQLTIKFGNLEKINAHQLSAILVEYLRANHAARELMARRTREQERVRKHSVEHK